MRKLTVGERGQTSHLALLLVGMPVAALLLAVSLAPLAAQAAEAEELFARIEFGDTVFDFGTMYQHQEVTHFFTFRNVGAAPLNIGKVKSTCGCTAAMPEKRELQPGEETKLKVTFKSGTFRDRITKHVHVDSNDPVEPRVTLTIQGRVKVEIDVKPRGIHVGSLKVGESVQRFVEIAPVDVTGFRILGVESENPIVRVGDPLPLGEDQPGYRLTIDIGPVNEPGRHRANIKVRTNLDHTKEFDISVYVKAVDAESDDAATST
jgi:hypothetical protein